MAAAAVWARELELAALGAVSHTRRDEITLPSYADALVRGAFAYNLASFICKDDLDSYWAESYRNRFLLALIESAPAQPELVVDVYGGQGDGE